MLAPLIPALFKNQLHTTYFVREEMLGREKGDGGEKEKLLIVLFFPPNFQHLSVVRNLLSETCCWNALLPKTYVWSKHLYQQKI